MLLPNYTKNADGIALWRAKVLNENMWIYLAIHV